MALETRSAKGAATRDQILDAATRLIHLRGYHCTSLDDVLRDSGVGKGNFYYYFKSKEELGYAIIDRVIERFVQETLAPALAEADGDACAQLRAFLDRVLETHRERNCVGGCAMGNLASELCEVHEGFRQRLADVFAYWRSTLAGVLAEGQRRQQIRPEVDPSSAAQFVVASLEGAILLAKLSRDIGVLERCVHELKEHLTLYANP